MGVILLVSFVVSIYALSFWVQLLSGDSPEILMRRTIRHAELDTLLCAHFLFYRERRRGGEFTNFKVGLLKCSECCLFVACGHIYAPWCHLTTVCLGRSKHNTHTQTVIQLFAPTVSPPSVLKYCLSSLALKPVLIVVCSFSSIRWAFCSPSPVELTFAVFHGFTR